MADFIAVAWQEHMQNIKDIRGENADTNEVTALFSQRRLLEHKSHFYWNSSLFQSYIDNKTIPMGLRIQLFPTLGTLWHSNGVGGSKTLLICSLTLLEILKEHYVKVDGEIQAFISKSKL